MQDEEILSEAAKCLHYAFNHNHDCPEDLREHFDCEYHQKLEEEKEMRKSIEEKRNEISEELLEKLKTGEPIEEINELEEGILKMYYVEGQTFSEIAEGGEYSSGYYSNLKQAAIDKIEGNDIVLLQCAYEHDDGSQCGRKKEFEQDNVPEEWYCWQHEDEQEPVDKRKEAQGEMIKQKGKIVDDSFAEEDDFAKAKAKTEELAEALNGKKENVENTKINVKDMSLEMEVEEPQKIEKDKYIELLTDKVEEIILESEFANEKYDKIKVDTSELWILDTMKAAVEGDERAQKFLKYHLKELG